MTSVGQMWKVTVQADKTHTIKKDSKGKVIQAVRMEKNIERKDGKQANKEKNVTDGIEEAMKSWNLRPRNNKSLLNANIAGNGLKASGSNGSTSSKADKGKAQSTTSNVRDIWESLTIPIALTPREIEEDLIAMGIKPTKRVKKRPKHVQNVIDRLSPGNNLKNISADTYHVSANSMKKQG